MRAAEAFAGAGRLEVRDYSPAHRPPPLSRLEEAELEHARAVFAAAEAAFIEARTVFEDGFRELGDPELEAECGGWKRIRQIYGKGVALADDNFDPLSLGQGSLGDCYLVSAMATVAAVPGFMERLFISKKVNAAGLYLLRLWDFRSQRWEYVWVNDRFPIRKGASLSFWDGSLLAMDSSTSDMGQLDGHGLPPLCMSLRNTNPVKVDPVCGVPADFVFKFNFWPMLLEKACAKLFGSYGIIGSGGAPESAMAAFVGGCATCCPLDLRAAHLAARIANGTLWMQLEAMDRAGFFIAAGVPAGRSRRRDGICDNGLVADHAYSLLRVVETTNAEGAVLRLLQLRNPWAEGEWNGRCSDSDTAFWTREMQHKLNYRIKTGPCVSGDANNDGVFFMLFEDFVHTFASLHVTSWFKDVRMSCRAASES